MVFTLDSILVALLIGFLPPLMWLYFWLREDKLHPEPRSALTLTFFTGMCVVFLVIPAERLVQSWALGTYIQYTAWAYVEEGAKFLAAYLAVLTRPSIVDEPLDPLIYMITAALGFAALENIFFLLNPASGDVLAQTLITGTMRFMGADVLHVVCSAAIGLALSLSFYLHGYLHHLYTLAGVILAGALHAVFNIFILQSSGAEVFGVFVYAWGGVILLLVAFEYIKRSTVPNNSPSGS